MTDLSSINDLARQLSHLVPREEFDAQQAVLVRTREKLEALERKLAELEARGGTPDRSAH